jgi:hypothetical protein
VPRGLSESAAGGPRRRSFTTVYWRPNCGASDFFANPYMMGVISWDGRQIAIGPTTGSGLTSELYENRRIAISGREYDDQLEYRSAAASPLQMGEFTPGD